MSLNPLDPAMLLLLGLDESGATATRDNAGQLGSAHDFTPVTASGAPDEGVPTISDGRGGRAAVIAQNPDSHPLWTDEWRLLRGKVENLASYGDHSASPTLPLSDAANDFAIGCRFKMVGPYTEGISDEDVNVLWAFGKAASAVLVLGLGFKWQDDTDEALGAQLWLTTPEGGSVGYPVTDLGGTPDFDSATGSPAQWYLTADQWYRIGVRYYYDGAGMGIKVYIYDETAATTYTYDLISPDTTDWASASNSDCAWQVGAAFDGAGGSAFTTAFAAVDECYLYDAPVSDSEMTDTIVDGIDIPWVAPVYEVLPNSVRVAVTNERTTFPPPRILPTGATAVDHPAGSYGTRPRVRYEGFRANRPWALQLASMMWDSAGRRKGRTNNRFDWENFDKGLIRVPGRLAKGSLSEVRGLEFSGFGARRRRGFQIIRDTDTARTSAAVNAFKSFRTNNDELFRCAKVGSALYEDQGSTMASISTGWNSSEMPSFVHINDRVAVLSAAKRVIWNGTAVSVFDGEAAPTGGSLGLTAGTLSGTFYYAYTFRDPISGDETAPVLLGAASPVSQGVLISSMDTAPTDARFTQQYIYRTVAGGAAPSFFLTAIQSNAATYTDSGDANGTIQIDHVNGTYTTLVAPEAFTFGVKHAGRCFYAGGTNGDRVYRSEANTLNSFQADAFTAHSGPVRAILSRGSSLVVLTDRTVEIVESDWVRDTNGASFERITEVSTTVGCVGHAAAIDANDQIFWLDRRGAYRLEGDTVRKISPLIDNVFRRLNWGIGDTFTVGYNFIREQLWFTVASAEFQTNSALRQTQLVYQLPNDVADGGQWTLHDLDATFCGQYDDDLNGEKFGIMDATGIWKELESYESDGLLTMTAATHESTMTAVSGATITDSTQAWTVDEFRGFGVVLRDVVTGLLHYYTIRSNTATVLTLDRTVNAVLAAADEFYIGGMNSFMELAEAQMGTSNRKMVRQLHTQFDDLTRGDNL